MSKSNFGTIENPYPQWLYEEMVQQHQWLTAAWVKLNNGTLIHFSPTCQPLETYYLGDKQNPYTWGEFQQLYPSNWTGGWVIDKNGRKVYYNSDGEEENDAGGSSGSGCGCVLEGASGSGSGSGDDFPIPDISRVKLLAGGQNCMFTLQHATLRFDLSWGTGYFSAMNLGPSISVHNTELTMEPFFSGAVSPLNARWENPFRAIITFNYTYSSRPMQESGSENLTTYYSIPEEFRQYEEDESF